jgi:hypothetical protein
MSIIPPFPEHHSLRLSDCATALATQTAERCIAAHVLCAIWPEQFDYPCRLEHLADVLLQAALCDLALVPWLAQQTGWPYDAAMLQQFSRCYVHALIGCARQELLAYLGDQHGWFHADAERQAQVGIQTLERWVNMLARCPSSCPDPLPGQVVQVSWPALRRALCDEEYASGRGEWRLCLHCGSLWKVWSPKRETEVSERCRLDASVHAQPFVLRMWSLVDVFCDWLHRISRCSPEQQVEIQGLLEQIGLHAARVKLPPQQQAAWGKYLEMAASLAGDHWLMTTNHLLEQASIGKTLCWAPGDLR